MIPIGEPGPAFTLPGVHGDREGRWSLADLRGRWALGSAALGYGLGLVINGFSR